MEHITTPNELKGIGRPLGHHIDDAQIEAYIDEVEQLYVKPSLGSDVFLHLIGSTKLEDPYKTLVEGGRYEYNGSTYIFKGLRMAIAYLVYAQNIMSGDFQSTRYGMVLKDNDYSQHLSGKERSDAYNNALEVGNQYLNECAFYCRAKGLSSGSSGRVNTVGSVRIRKIG